MLTEVIAGQAWKFGAIGILLTMLASDVYLGYQWHSAASARDTAVTERKHAETERDAAQHANGELTAHIANQNASILDLARASTTADAKYAQVMQAFAPVKLAIDDLARRVASQAPSVTCEQSLAKQRRAIEELRGVGP